MDIKYSSAEGTICLGNEVKTEAESGVDDKIQIDPLAIGDESFEDNGVKSISMEIESEFESKYSTLSQNLESIKDNEVKSISMEIESEFESKDAT